MLRARHAGLLILVASLSAPVPAALRVSHPGLVPVQHHRLSLLQEPAQPQKQFNCTEVPAGCAPPFNCHEGVKDINVRLATDDGHPNWNSWCKAEAYTRPAVKCQRGDLKGYGEEMHLVQYLVNPVTEWLDAHYCFAHGHCDDTEITLNTTLAEAEQICDKRFGPEWRTMSGRTDTAGFPLRWSLMGPHLSKASEELFARIACGMGNYHCDAIYCKQEYCRKRAWRIRWGSERPLAMKRANGKEYPKPF